MKPIINSGWKGDVFVEEAFVTLADGTQATIKVGDWGYIKGSRSGQTRIAGIYKNSIAQNHTKRACYRFTLHGTNLFPVIMFYPSQWIPKKKWYQFWK